MPTISLAAHYFQTRFTRKEKRYLKARINRELFNPKIFCFHFLNRRRVRKLCRFAEGLG